MIGELCGIAAAGDPVQALFHQTNDDLNRFMTESNIPLNLKVK
jgi:hypothetical protein